MPIAAKLSRKLHETFGDEAAEAMVDWMHRVESGRAELRELNDLNYARIDARFGEGAARIDARFAEEAARIDARFAEEAARVDARFAALEAKVDAKFEAFEARFDAKLDTLESSLRQEMDAGFSDLRQGLSQLEVRIERRFGDLMKWSFVFWVGSVVTIVLALATMGRLRP